MAQNVFQMMARRMDYATTALKLAAENMANRYMPQYKARRLQPLKFDQVLDAINLRVTQPGHLSNHALNGFRVREKSGGQETFSGNTVSHTEELQQANEASMTHRQMVNLIQAYAQMIEMPLKR